MTMQEAYERYYDTAVYDKRYPAPNPLTMARVRAVLKPGGTLLDIGAGNGRYAVPLADDGHRVIAVERSAIARDQLRQRIVTTGTSDAIEVHASLEDAADFGGAKTALLLFGVFGHMTYAERTRTLSLLSLRLGHEATVVGSVPNRLRRFQGEQANSRIEDAGDAPRFRYRRTLDGAVSTFEYTAFTPSELSDELHWRGWSNVILRPESILPESIIANHSIVARLDGAASRILHPELGYGIYFQATYCPTK